MATDSYDLFMTASGY